MSVKTELDESTSARSRTSKNAFRLDRTIEDGSNLFPEIRTCRNIASDIFLPRSPLFTSLTFA
jgi:hypothetical protein